MSTIKLRHIDVGQQIRINNIVYAAENLDGVIMENCPKSRQREIALQKLEEAAMWANKAIAYEGVDE